ncbi:MAG: hypothetical protein LBS26_01630 [Campylobacteraceae bacterium]|nr:hypothetical protein [Campylobacteraceae bacterium]
MNEIEKRIDEAIRVGNWEKYDKIRDEQAEAKKQEKQLSDRREANRQRVKYRNKAKRVKQYQLTIARKKAIDNVTYGLNALTANYEINLSDTMKNTVEIIKRFDNLKILELLNEYYKKTDNDNSVDYYFELIHLYQVLKTLQKTKIIGAHFRRKIKYLQRKGESILPNIKSFYIENISFNNSQDEVTLGLNKNDFETILKEIIRETLSIYDYNARILPSQRSVAKFHEKSLSIIARDFTH